MAYLWAALLVPFVLLALMLFLGWCEWRLTRQMLSDDVRRYLARPEDDDEVEAEIARLAAMLIGRAH
jgi:cytochrome c-type biogenesis protein CcmH/NrfG